MESGKHRLYLLDAARALGVVLVYYGHLVSEAYEGGNQAAFLHYKLIYSFHMPLFFFISGYFYPKQYSDFLPFFRSRILLRLVPVLLFAAIGLLFWSIYQLGWEGRIDLPVIAWKALGYLRGIPELWLITWFLVCLFTTELLAFPIASKIRSERLLIWAMGGIYILGFLLTDRIGAVVRVFGIQKNTWYIHEAIFVLSFYLLGLLFSKKSLFTRQFSFPIRLLLGLIASCTVFLTFDLNHPGDADHFVVMIATSTHGQLWPFTVTSIAGIVAVLAISTLLPKLPFVEYLGKNSLLFFCWNGIFALFINKPLLQVVQLRNSHESVVGYCSLITFLSLIVSALLTALMHKFIPQLVGKPKATGPFLPNIEEIDYSCLAGKAISCILRLRSRVKRTPFES
jgi:acyltransferase